MEIVYQNLYYKIIILFFHFIALGSDQHGDASERGCDESCDGSHDEVQGHARVFEIVKFGSFRHFNADYSVMKLKDVPEFSKL